VLWPFYHFYIRVRSKCLWRAILITLLFLDIIHFSVIFYLKQRFGDWILSPTSVKSLLSWAESIELVLNSEHLREHSIAYINQAQHKTSVRVKTNIWDISLTLTLSQHAYITIFVLRISPRYSDALETISVSGPFSKLNVHSVGHWWKQDQLEMPSRWSSVCTASHVIVADVTSAKQADL
jgi:hypothetical protein